ncbi:hypothetical protein NO976_01790 [Planktothrix agardhii]|jgi:hypothetical protein|uniref:hypothetical protein n=1 Tax=Planktothrix agardhii TaxID=1160 RepID=UPI0020A78FFC|nr:hypothetical protein [Planktothrix agardhii]CAD5938003.1 hypothetical protein NO976_01790 [Planktothrix agardhii]
MQEKLDKLFQVDSENWLEALPKYQQVRVRELLSSTTSYEDAAKQWLDAMPENTFPFGAERAKNVFLEKVQDELEALPKYQQVRVSSTTSYEDAAKQWLDAMPENTFPFGAERAKNVFLEKVQDEIEKFLCGDEKYADERKELLSSSELLQTTFVSAVSAAIASTIGAAATYVMPIVVLLFMTMGKITLNAWCQMRRDSKTPPK